jgi:hypothetical protein
MAAARSFSVLDGWVFCRLWHCRSKGSELAGGLAGTCLEAIDDVPQVALYLLFHKQDAMNVVWTLHGGLFAPCPLPVPIVFLLHFSLFAHKVTNYLIKIITFAYKLNSGRLWQRKIKS